MRRVIRWGVLLLAFVIANTAVRIGLQRLRAMDSADVEWVARMAVRAMIAEIRDYLPPRTPDGDEIGEVGHGRVTSHVRVVSGQGDRDVGPNVYAELFERVAAGAHQLPDRELSLSATRVESFWIGDLIVHGRAVDGCDSPWRPRDLADRDRRRAIYESVIRRDSASEKCPMG